MYMQLTQTNITIMLMLLLAGTTEKSQQGRHFQTARALSLWPFSPFDYSKMEDGQTGHGNPECEYYSSWMEDSDVDSEESPRAEGMAPKPKTAFAQALYPQVQLSLGDDSNKRKRSKPTSEGQKKKVKESNGSSAITTATSPVSLASDVGLVGTQGASDSRERARAHSKKLFNTMVTKTHHVDNPPKWEEGTEADFCNQKTFTRLAGYLSDVTENNSEAGHRTPEGNLLLCSTALNYLQDFFQVVKSKYEATGTDKTKLFFISATTVLPPLQMN